MCSVAWFSRGGCCLVQSEVVAAVAWLETLIAQRMAWSIGDEMQIRSPTLSRNSFLQSPLHKFGAIVLLITVIAVINNHNNNSETPGITPDTSVAIVPHSTMTACPEKIQYRKVSSDDDITRYAAYCKKEPVSIEAWTTSLAANTDQAEPIMQIIQQSPYVAVCFETKGCNAQNWGDKQFEFVLVNVPQLQSFAESTPDANAFSEHFGCSTPEGCAFANLGNSAQLIAPKPMGKTPLTAYSHLAAFCRGAPHDQVATLWSLAAKEYQQRITSFDKTTWFSTAGMGVAWLHFRLDDRPKYYRYTEFKKET